MSSPVASRKEKNLKIPSNNYSFLGGASGDFVYSGAKIQKFMQSNSGESLDDTLYGVNKNYWNDLNAIRKQLNLPDIQHHPSYEDGDSRIKSADFHAPSLEKDLSSSSGLEYTPPKKKVCLLSLNNARIEPQNEEDLIASSFFAMKIDEFMIGNNARRESEDGSDLKSRSDEDEILSEESSVTSPSPEIPEIPEITVTDVERDEIRNRDDPFVVKNGKAIMELSSSLELPRKTYECYKFPAISSITKCASLFENDNINQLFDKIDKKPFGEIAKDLVFKNKPSLSTDNVIMAKVETISDIVTSFHQLERKTQSTQIDYYGANSTLSEEEEVTKSTVSSKASKCDCWRFCFIGRRKKQIN